MTNTQLLALDPARLDQLVTEAVSDGKTANTQTMGSRLRHVKADKAPRLTQAGLALGCARVAVLDSQGWARRLLGEARLLAGDTDLGDVFDTTALVARIDQRPRVVDGRFAPDCCGVWTFQDECWVVCPKCGGAAVEADKVVHCTKCLYRAEYDGNSSTWERACSPWFLLPLLLTVSTSLGDVWAYNSRHLEQLRAYVAATLRDERNNVGRSWSSRLPAWMKAAKNRDTVLKALDRLGRVAAEAKLV